MGGSAFNTPLNYGDVGAQFRSNPVQTLLAITAQQQAQQDRQIRAGLAQSLVEERAQRTAIEAEKLGGARFARDLEFYGGVGGGGGGGGVSGATTGGGGGGGIPAEVAPYFQEAYGMSRRTDPRPGPPLAPGMGTTQGPAYQGDIQQAFQQGAERLRGATTAAGEALPPGTPESEAIRGRVARGELRVPSAVYPAYEQALKTGQEAQTLSKNRQLQPAEVAKGFSDADIAGYGAYIKGVEAQYATAVADAKLKGDQALADLHGIQTRTARREGGELPLIPDSPEAIKADQARATLEKTRVEIRDLNQKAAEHRQYIEEVARFRRTGDIRDLNAAVLTSTGGATSLANIIAQGRQLDLTTKEFIIRESGKLMVQKQALDAHVAKKGDLKTAEDIARDINLINTTMAAVSEDPNVQWKSVRQEEGAFGGVVQADVTMPREVAIRLRNKLVQPTSAGGLKALLAASAGDLVNAMAAGDVAAGNKLVAMARSYPGVTREASDAVVTELTYKLADLGQGTPGIYEDRSQGIIRRLPPPPTPGVVPGGTGQLLQFPRAQGAERLLQLPPRGAQPQTTVSPAEKGVGPAPPPPVQPAPPAAAPGPTSRGLIAPPAAAATRVAGGGGTNLPEIPPSANPDYVKAITREVLASNYPGISMTRLMQDPRTLEDVRELVKMQYWSRLGGR